MSRPHDYVTFTDDSVIRRAPNNDKTKLRSSGIPVPEIPDYLFKIVFLGEGAVGKTSLVGRYVYDSFEGDYLATIGTDIHVKKVHVDNTSVKLVVWDIAGQDDFAQLRKAYYQNASPLYLLQWDDSETSDEPTDTELDKAEAELQIINEREVPVNIRGNIIGHKGVKEISPKEVDFIVDPKENKTIKIGVAIDLTTETYVPRQEPRKRTRSRISAHLEINGKTCQLGCGWVPKDVFQVALVKRSLYFGKNTNEVIFPLGFRNLTKETINGNLSITGEGLSNPYLLDFNLHAESAMEALIPIQKPAYPVSKSWKWNLEFKIKKESRIQTLPLITTHISCFTKTGAVAYINSKPNKEAIIENEFLRLHFPTGPNTWYALRTIFVKEMGIILPIAAFSIRIPV